MLRWIIAVMLLVPAAASARQGTWSDAFPFGPNPNNHIYAIHLVHVYSYDIATGLPTGKILAITYQDDPSDPDCLSARDLLWTPPLGGQFIERYENPRLCRTDMFCAGHSALSDGRLFCAGGNYTQPNATPTFQADVFDAWLAPGVQWNNPATPPDMMYRRFYPTCTTLADGRVLVTSGTIVPYFPDPPIMAKIPELYDPATNSWTQLNNAEYNQAEYPEMFVLPDGNLVDAGPLNEFYPHPSQSRMLLAGGLLDAHQWTWGPYVSEPVTALPPGEHGSAAMYEPGKIMKCGGKAPNSHMGVATTWVVDLSVPLGGGTPQAWMPAADMNIARTNHNLVVLPDGTILAVGGADRVEEDGNAQTVYQPELFDPAANTWTLQPASQFGLSRRYHSTAILLRDGTVLSAGGDYSPTAQVFTPPYITGYPRSVIASAPQYMQYNTPYTIQYNPNGGKAVSKVCLMRLGADTHGFDQDQRRVPLKITGSQYGPTLGQLNVKSPVDGNTAPPGYYMLFILSEPSLNKQVPCQLAAYVRVGP